MVTLGIIALGTAVALAWAVLLWPLVVFAWVFVIW